MESSLDSLIKLYLFSSGRRLFALRKVRTAAESMGVPALVALVEEAIAHEQTARELDLRWRTRTRTRTRSPGMQGLDALVDNTLSGLHASAMALIRGVLPGDPIIGKVQALLGEILPSGVGPVTSLPYVEEASAVDIIVARLQGPLAPLVAELGLGRQVERLAALAVQYRAALESSAPAGMSFATVREARERGQQYLFEIVALILGTYHRWSDPAHVAGRATLLAPILEQSAAIRAAIRARRVVRDVDPDTGEPEPGEPADPATSPAAADPA